MVSANGPASPLTSADANTSKQPSGRNLSPVRAPILSVTNGATGGMAGSFPSSSGSLLAEYQDFAKEDFDHVEYANLIIRPPAGKSYHRSDIATSLSKLSISVDHLNKQIHDQVCCASHHVRF
jgi:hypothetical protein